MREKLINISNAIYTRVHNYYNTRSRLTDAFASCGLSDTPTQGQINQLSTSQIRTLKTAVLKVVIDALELGTLEDSLGYDSIQAAHDAAPEHLPDLGELAAVQGNLMEFIGLQAALSKMTDKGLALTQTLGAKGLVDALDNNGAIDKFNLVALPLT